MASVSGVRLKSDELRGLETGVVSSVSGKLVISGAGLDNISVTDTVKN